MNTLLARLTALIESNRLVSSGRNHWNLVLTLYTAPSERLEGSAQQRTKLPSLDPFWMGSSLFSSKGDLTKNEKRWIIFFRENFFKEKIHFQSAVRRGISSNRLSDKKGIVLLHSAWSLIKVSWMNGNPEIAILPQESHSWDAVSPGQSLALISDLPAQSPKGDSGTNEIVSTPAQSPRPRPPALNNGPRTYILPAPSSAWGGLGQAWGVPRNRVYQQWLVQWADTWVLASQSGFLLFSLTRTSSPRLNSKCL